MKNLMMFLTIFGVFFILNYEGYYFNPCDGDVCLAIPGYTVAPDTKICDSLLCVEGLLEKTGMEHFKNAYKITLNFCGFIILIYDEYNKTAKIEPVEITYKATVKKILEIK